MTEEIEIWKEIKDFEGRFWISSFGRLKSHDHRKNTIKILSPYIDSQGYYQATLRHKTIKEKSSGTYISGRNIFSKTYSTRTLDYQP